MADQFVNLPDGSGAQMDEHGNVLAVWDSTGKQLSMDGPMGPEAHGSTMVWILALGVIALAFSRK